MPLAHFTNISSYKSSSGRPIRRNMKEQQHKLILSRGLNMILKRINDPVSKKLLFLDNNGDYGFPMSYIDLTDKGDTITFTPSKKVIELFGNVPRPEQVVWMTSRNEQKIGRFISKITGEDPQRIENFVNHYKAEIKSMNNLDNFEIVKGKDLAKFYLAKFYSKGGGSLNKSCMRHDHCQDYFNFYKINPEKVSLIVLYEDDSRKKILGRALMWNVDEPNIVLMDRIYTSNDSDQNLFIKLAIKNGWYYKKSQRFDEQKFIDPNGKEVTTKCKIFLKEADHRYFPYLDTFYYFDKNKSYITNDIEDYRNNKYIVKLRATDGREQGNENFVFDTYNNDFIKADDSIYCELSDARIYMNDAIKVGRYFTTPDDVRFSEYDGLMYNKKDVTWSTTHSTFIDKRKAFRVYFDNQGTMYDNIHSDLKGEKFDYVPLKDSYFIKDLLVKGIDNQFHLKDEYNEEEIKIRMKKRDRFSTADDLNSFFDEFVSKKIGKETFNLEYGTFDSTRGDR